MAIFNKEMRKGMVGFIIWTGAIVFMLVICILMYPEMKSQMSEMNNMFANMGSFTKAFGMDSLNFGTLIGFYGVECGNMLGLGGGFFAAFVGITMLSKEERAHTAEFLLTHPLKRTNIIMQKALAVLVQILLLNIITYGISVACIAAIGETIPWKELTLIHIAYLLLQIEIGLICFGISSFLKKGSIGVGLGAAAVLYFMNIICNISKSAEFLKYITPYSYAEPAKIIENNSLDGLLVALGLAYAIVLLAVGTVQYAKKDIAS